eukprot:6962387-Heterocapsa_arctica.AAC.1
MESRGRNVPLPPRRQERTIVQRKRTEGHICQKHNRTTSRQHRGICNYRRDEENTVEAQQDEE